MSEQTTFSTASSGVSAEAFLSITTDPLAPDAEDALLNDIMSEWFSADAGLDILPVEEGGEEPPDQPEEYQQRVTSRIETGMVDESDYEEGPQRYAFELLRDNCRDVYVQSVKPKERYEAINWMFIPGQDEITFDICCQALGVRPNLIRIRMMYQFFQKWIVFPAPLPLLTVGLPEVICGEILYHEGEGALKLAKRIWSWPSITLQRVHEYAIEEKIDDWYDILERMDQSGMIANRTGNLYFTGRNPSEMSTVKRNAFNWAHIDI